MNLEYDDEQTALRESVSRFLGARASVADHVRALADDPTGNSDAVWKGLVDLGVTGLLVPEAAGGAGASMVEAGIVAQQMGAFLNPGPWLSSAVCAVRALVRVGAPTDDPLWSGIAEGTTVATLAVPSDAKNLLRIDGDTITATVHRVADCAAADSVLLFADSADGIGLFAVDLRDGGVSVTPGASVSATRKVFGVGFDRAPVRRISDATDRTVASVVDDVLVAYAADAVGAAESVLAMAVDYAKTRTQFGHPIGSYQAVQHLCVEMFDTVELARSGVMRALWTADAAPAEVHRAAAVNVKAFSGRLAAVGDKAIQVFGGIGYTHDHDAHLYLKRLLHWSSFLGGPDRYLREAGKNLVRDVLADA